MGGFLPAVFKMDKSFYVLQSHRYVEVTLNLRGGSVGVVFAAVGLLYHKCLSKKKKKNCQNGSLYDGAITASALNDRVTSAGGFLF